MSRGYLSRRIAQSMRAPLLVETPDTDRATVYRQQWRRQDGSMARTFDVLALDEDMAQEMGMLRLSEKYGQDAMQWHLDASAPLLRTTALIQAVLMAEEPDETKLREQAFFDRIGDGPVAGEVVR